MESKHYITDVSFKALIMKDNAILFVRETEHKTGISKWELPGGRLHVGETIEECINREMQEELGIKVHIGKLLHCFPNVSASGKNHFICIFKIEPTDATQVPKVNTSEIDELRYITKEEIGTLPMWAEYENVFYKNFFD